MKLILWLLALFAAAVAVTLAAKNTTGRALLEMPPYQLELPLDQFIIGAVAVFSFSISWSGLFWNIRVQSAPSP